MEIIEQLTRQLGIDEAQASGGAGLLFKLAKDKLGSAEFAQLRAAVPEVDQLIETAPDAGTGRLGGLGGLASVFGGKIGALGNLASLAEGFGDLGLDSGTVARFLPLVLSWVQARGGDGVRDMLAGVLAVENQGWKD
jgi:hypothetical protein